MIKLIHIVLIVSTLPVSLLAQKTSDHSMNHYLEFVQPNDSLEVKYFFPEALLKWTSEDLNSLPDEIAQQYSSLPESLLDRLPRFIDSDRALEYSFIEQHDHVVKLLSKYRQEPVVDNNLANLIGDYELVSALDEIVSLSTSRRLVMINESHYRGRHRVFTELLLKRLRDKGFTHLSLEALSPQQARSFKDKTVPIEAGGYMRQPTFSNMVRTALELGYEVIGHESSLRARELGQAENIIKYLNKSDSVKVIAHVGFGHINENPEIQMPPANTPMLAAIIKDSLKIDPLTINQTVWMEYSKGKSSQYFQIAQSLGIKESSLFKNKIDGTYLVESSYQGDFDLQVVHPRTDLINGRPDWLRRLNYKNYYRDIPEGFEQSMLLVYKSSESLKDHLPVDILYLSGDDSKPLILKPGLYDLYYFKRNGEQLTIKEVDIR